MVPVNSGAFFYMPDTLLSVLVCTLPSRVSDHLPRIIQKLNRQSLGRPVEVLYLGDNKSMTVGEKRNNLLAMAKGKFIAFIDDDDDISDNYIPRIIKYIEDNPKADVFTPAGRIDRDGRAELQFEFDLAHGRNFNKNGIAHRSPNHICVTRREKVQSIKFENKSLSEDNKWAARIRKHLSNEVKMPDVEYYYNFSYSGTETQHHLKRIKKHA